MKLLKMNKTNNMAQVINLGNDTYIIKGVKEVPSEFVPINKEINTESLTRIEKQLNLGWVVGSEVKIEELAQKVATIVKGNNTPKHNTMIISTYKDK